MIQIVLAFTVVKLIGWLLGPGRQEIVSDKENVITEGRFFCSIDPDFYAVVPVLFHTICTRFFSTVVYMTSSEEADMRKMVGSMHLFP